MCCDSRYSVFQLAPLCRQLDFDLDGEADCLGLHVGGLGVIVAEDSVDNVLSGTFTSPEDYLRAFSRNTSLL